MHTSTIIDENTTIKVAFMVSGTVTGGVLDGKSAFEEIHIIFICILHHLYVDWIANKQGAIILYIAKWIIINFTWDST